MFLSTNPLHHQARRLIWDELLQWSNTLDFDSYHNEWLGTATSARQEWPADDDLRSASLTLSATASG